MFDVISVDMVWTNGSQDSVICVALHGWDWSVVWLWIQQSVIWWDWSVVRLYTKKKKMHMFNEHHSWIY